MNHVMDLRSIGTSYKIYDKQNEAYVKTMYVIESSDLVECTGKFNGTYDTISEFIDESLPKVSGYLDLSRVSWYVTSDHNYEVDALARLIMNEGTDIVVVERVDHQEDEVY